MTSPSVEAARRAAQDPSSDQPALTAAVLKGQRELVEIEGRRKFFELRNLWTIIIATWVSALLIFHICLAVAIGLGWLNFEKYKWFIPLIVGENFLQIVGMGYIVTRHLFPGGGKGDLR